MKWVIGVLITLSLIPIIVAWGMAGPGSLRRQFARESAERTSPVVAGLPVTDADVAHLPVPLQRYLRIAGVVGRARPATYRLTFTGRIRGGPGEPWMPFEAEQYSAVSEPLRLFYMRARRGGIPVAVLHRFAGGEATMRVKLAGLWPLVDARGPVMDRSETVTVFNDMCLLAPGTLLDPRITWRERDERSVDATFVAGGQTIDATLTFDHRGMLTNFESADRSRASADGRSFTRLPFLTPVRAHRAFDGILVAHEAEAQWRMAHGELFTYAEFRVEAAAFDRRFD